MTDLIKVPYDELPTRAKTIRDQADVVDAEIRGLSRTIESLNWMGQRGDRFATMWNDALPAMHEWVAALRGFADELDDQARRAKAADQAF